MNQTIGKMKALKGMLMALFAAALLVAIALGATWGIVQGQESGSVQSELEEARRQLKADPSRGYISTGGNTGRIVSIDTGVHRIAVDTPKGSLNVSLGEHTVIKKYRGDTLMTIDDLKPGDLVVVDKARTEAGDATKIEMVPEGKGGYNLTPGKADGPNLLPVFP